MDNWTLPGFTEIEPLGEGNFGRVVLARHEESGTVVAIKYLHARYLGTAYLDTFRAEAHALHRVHSPYVTRLYEFIERPEGAAIVMEAVPGVPLKAILTGGPLEPEAALAVLKGSLLGLADAHAVGTVHRDYKPDNVLVGPDRQSKLVDFGIAVLAGQSGAAIGTPAYMAPEQWHGNPASPATDVYAATCVFFRAVTGHRPYQAEDTEALRALHQYAPIPFGEVPEPLRQLIARGMAKDLAARPATAAAFVTELESAATSAYGPEWEERGRSRLAERAGALLALSPLAFLATGTSALAPGAGVVAGVGTSVGGGVGASVGAGVTATGGGLLATVTAKIVAVVAVLAVGIGTVLVVTGDDDPQPRATSAEETGMQVSLETSTRSFDDLGFALTAHFPRVSGHADPAIQRKINESLRAPVRSWVEYLREGFGSAGANRPDRVAQAKVDASIRNEGPSVVSVVYRRSAGSPIFGNHGGGSLRAVTVDLRTGDIVRASDLFDVSSGQSVNQLEGRIRARAPEGYCDAGEELTAKPMRPLHFEPFRPAGGPAVQTVPTRSGVEFVIYAPAFRLAMACGYVTVAVPYQQLREALTPLGMRLLVDGQPQADSGNTHVDLGAFRITLPEGWRMHSRTRFGWRIRTEDCASFRSESSCRNVLVRDNSEHSPGMPAHTKDQPYTSGNSDGCASAGVQDGQELVHSGLRPIGSKQAWYREWQLHCSNYHGDSTVTQRVWFLPESEIVIVDRWRTPGLQEVLATAHWE